MVWYFFFCFPSIPLLLITRPPPQLHAAAVVSSHSTRLVYSHIPSVIYSPVNSAGWSSYGTSSLTPTLLGFLAVTLYRFSEEYCLRWLVLIGVLACLQSGFLLLWRIPEVISLLLLLAVLWSYYISTSWYGETTSVATSVLGRDSLIIGCSVVVVVLTCLPCGGSILRMG